MNQEKIGKFIAECRRDKNITQALLGEKLGVTEKSISNWENGRNMPDLSLFKPLCDILDISINELLSGERLEIEVYQDRLEENILNTINYSTNRLHKYNQFISIILIIFGLFISLSAIMIFPSESSWSSIYSIFGIIIFMVGISRLLSMIKIFKRLILIVFIFICVMSLLLFSDYINVKNNGDAPIYRLATTYAGDVVYYDTLFYDAYKCSNVSDYFVVQENKNHSVDELIDYCK